MIAPIDGPDPPTTRIVYLGSIAVATLGVAIAVMGRFTNVFGVQHLEPVIILILAYTTLVYIVTERAKVLHDIHENLGSPKAEVYPTRVS